MRFSSTCKKSISNLNFLIKGGSKQLIVRDQTAVTLRLQSTFATSMPWSLPACSMLPPEQNQCCKEKSKFLNLKFLWNCHSDSEVSFIFCFLPPKLLSPSLTLYISPLCSKFPSFPPSRILPSTVYPLILNKVLVESRLILWESWSHWPKYLLTAL